MKVYLGPYHHWFKPGRWFKNWVFWLYGYTAKNKDTIDYEKFDELDDQIRKNWLYRQLMRLERWIDNMYTRKTRVRIDYYDTWGADHTLAVIALPLLQALKEKKQGSPDVDDADVPEELRSTSAPPLTEEQKAVSCTDNNFHKRWEWTLDEMIWALSQVVDEDADSQFFTHHDEPEQPGSIFNKCDFDKEGYEKWQARKQHGLMLFGKYFEALWD